MSKMKKIIVNCHEPIAIDKKYDQTWSDVYLRFKSKPGKKVYLYNITLISKISFDEDVDIIKKSAEKYKELNFSQELEKNQLIEDYLTKGIIYVDNGNDNSYDIYTPTKWINRTEANRLLNYFLNKIGHSSNFKFVWKRPKLIVTPM